MKKVSIIIPTYQSEKTIKKCISSILGQSWLNLELIIVDDGSIDKTVSIIRKIKKEYQANIKLYTQKNSGVSVARNKGLKVASGNYLMFIDSDDFIDCDYVKKLVTTIENDHSEFIADIPRTTNNKVEEEGIIWKGKLSEISPIFGEQYSRMRFNNVCAKLYRAELAKSIRFPQNIKIGEDLLYNLQYLSLCKNISLFDSNGYHYVENIKSATHKFHHDDFFNQKKLYNLVLNFCSSHLQVNWYDEVRDVYVKNVLGLILLLIGTSSFTIKEKIHYIKVLRNDPDFYSELIATNLVSPTLKMVKKFFIKKMYLSLIILGICYNLKVKLWL
ncbi:glycosyltransferase [Limosilactobacillus reuteri]|uniref:glycosyltransferase family 2 protein n=1 Tax=Limosilactobacillus reuteri TaxID=1598 RepID=UPI001E380BCF|nr:glycosyltransferase family 2 protein [Limosilactobacillus reuteri]MCC4328782.1 glycosyltransferase [Limosilactobacillus reuteri]MCC4335114.1 glycosyltransferase [Limosilactobacillus reuteri]MCC4339029.1 glycosyltransferase [Limosilactobacillus reuteri]